MSFQNDTNYNRKSNLKPTMLDTTSGYAKMDLADKTSKKINHRLKSRNSFIG